MVPFEIMDMKPLKSVREGHRTVLEVLEFFFILPSFFSSCELSFVSNLFFSRQVWNNFCIFVYFEYFFRQGQHFFVNEKPCRQFFKSREFSLNENCFDIFI